MDLPPQHLKQCGCIPACITPGRAPCPSDPLPQCNVDGSCSTPEQVPCSPLQLNVDAPPLPLGRVPAPPCLMQYGSLPPLNTMWMHPPHHPRTSSLSSNPLPQCNVEPPPFQTSVDASPPSQVPCALTPVPSAMWMHLSQPQDKFPAAPTNAMCMHVPYPRTRSLQPSFPMQCGPPPNTMWMQPPWPQGSSLPPPKTQGQSSPSSSSMQPGCSPLNLAPPRATPCSVHTPPPPPVQCGRAPRPPPLRPAPPLPSPARWGAHPRPPGTVQHGRAPHYSLWGGWTIPPPAGGWGGGLRLVWAASYKRPFPSHNTPLQGGGGGARGLTWGDLPRGCLWPHP